MAAFTEKTLNLISCLGYKDADAGVAWLMRAFDFKEHAIYRGEDGRVMHAELTFGNGMIMIGPDGGGEFGKRFMTLPERAGGRCTQVVCIIVEDVDAHHDRAKAAGAEIVMPPTDQSYGGRNYAARDPEGHVWSIGSYDPMATAVKA
jgi:uncharacterized glyoxalase superfamily protein PhnB